MLRDLAEGLMNHHEQEQDPHIRMDMMLGGKVNTKGQRCWGVIREDQVRVWKECLRRNLVPERVQSHGIRRRMAAQHKKKGGSERRWVDGDFELRPATHPATLATNIKTEELRNLNGTEARR